jgi:hypothetical protein
MDTNVSAADTGGEATDIVAHTAGGEGALSVRDAARSLNDWRNKRNAEESPAQDEPATETPAQELADEANAGEATPPPGETADDNREAELPPIDPPRSWTAEDKEFFKALPRETQERIAERERSREIDFNRRQQEAAEKLKGLTAKEQQAEQVRQQYEQALPMLLQTLQAQQAGEFADIKTMADVEKLAREDWPRYVLWDAQQKKIAAVSQEVMAAQQRQEAEKRQKWSTFAREQDSLFVEKAPELADPETAAKVQKSAATYLSDLGFSQDDLAAMWNGEKDLSLRDHRVQLLIRDGVRYREAQAQAKVKAVKTVPQVQRPGVARPSPTEADARVQALTQKFNETGNLKDAAALLAARRAAARR